MRLCWIKRCCLCYRRLSLPREVIFLFFFLSSFVFFVNIIPPPPVPNVKIIYPAGQIPMLIQDNGEGTTSVTIVTAFFDIGSFVKGENSIQISLSRYQTWFQSFRHLLNPLCVYTDSPAVEEEFRKLRKGLLKITTIKRVDRETLWSFQLREDIARVYADPEYPRFPPNTVLPEYTCTQHAKYDVMQEAIRSRAFGTRYYAWLDIGYFRYIADRGRDFRITLPPDFDDEKVAFNLVGERESLLQDPSTVFLQNRVRFGGGFFVGQARVLDRFIEHYKRSAEYFLTRGLSDTDQQVLYSMFTTHHSKLHPPPVQIQAYRSQMARGDVWFYLGYLCYRER